MSWVLRRLARDEGGMTVVEVVVAALILVVSGLATLSVVDAATRNTYRAQQSQVIDNRLQHEMEQLKQVPYEQLALTSVPAQSADPANPNSRVSGTTFNLARAGTANPAQLVYNGSALYGGGNVSGGQVSTGPTAFESGDVKGNIYRYVVWQNDGACSDTQCPGAQDYKLLVVSASINTTGSGGTRTYQEIQSAVPNPAAEVACPPGGCPAGGGPNVKPWTFWLTDTPCNFNTRQSIVPVGGTDGHPTHNTRGVCNQGMQTGNTFGAPDLMYVQPAPLDNNYSSDQQPMYDYSTDVEPNPNPGNDKGLQETNGSSCNLVSSLFGQLPLIGGANPNTAHKWITPAIPTGYSLLFNGTGQLNLWTRSINGDVQPGKICIWLYMRHVALDLLGIPIYIDTPAINLDLGSLNFFTHSQNPWPTNWTELHIPLNFQLNANIPLIAGDRLGLAISVDGTGTGSSGLQFLYDHPSFDSRLELQTSSVLPIF